MIDKLQKIKKCIENIKVYDCCGDNGFACDTIEIINDGAKEALATLNEMMERLDSEELVDKSAKAIYELEPNYNSLGRKTEWHNLEASHWKPYYRKKSQAAINVIKGESK